MTFRQTTTALGKFRHPDGELNLTRAAAKHGIIQMVLRHHVSISAVTTDTELILNTYSIVMFL